VIVAMRPSLTLSLTISVVFFASIREELGCKGLQIEVPEGSTVADLVSILVVQHDETWREALTAENVRIAIDQELISGNLVLLDGAELAFFPPVTGG
jgi:molybdopterin synthase sulfur carrier subunit